MNIYFDESRNTGKMVNDNIIEADIAEPIITNCNFK